MQDQYSPVDPDRAEPFDQKNPIKIRTKKNPDHLGGKPTRPKFPIQFSEYDYVREVVLDDRALIETRLSAAIIYFVEHGRPVYLEALGIIIPNTQTGPICHIHDRLCIVRHETSLSIDFEKCGEIVSYHRRKYQKLVELRELSARIYPELPLELQLRWSERDFRKILRGLCRFIRFEVVEYSRCQLLDFGVFYALHNRQGLTSNDWFAGADIFIKSNFQRVSSVGPHRSLERPVLRSSWELLEAIYGKPLGVFSINIAEQLKELGYCEKTFKEERLNSASGHAHSNVEVAVFHTRNQSKPDQHLLIYCTDGLRRIANSSQLQNLATDVEQGEFGHREIVGNEFVFQLALSSEDEEFNEESIPAWPTRPLTMAWILLQSSRSHTVDIGAGIASEVPLIGECDTDLRTIFTSRFSTVKSEQLSEDGSFSYINIVAITEEEALVARRYSPDLLLTLLEHRKLDQITRTTRSSLVAKSGLIAGPSVG